MPSLFDPQFQNQMSAISIYITTGIAFILKRKVLLKYFCEEKFPFVGALVSLVLISGDVSYWFQNQSGQPYSQYSGKR